MRPIGGRRDEPIDVWILAATDHDLREVQLGKLDVLIPPLRQRPDDILLLAEHFLARVCAEHRLPPKSFALDARSALLAYGWPGNVREVNRVIERVAFRFAENEDITSTMLALPNWNESTG